MWFKQIHMLLSVYRNSTMENRYQGKWISNRWISVEGFEFFTAMSPKTAIFGSVLLEHLKRELIRGNQVEKKVSNTLNISVIFCFCYTVWNRNNFYRFIFPFICLMLLKMEVKKILMFFCIIWITLQYVKVVEFLNIRNWNYLFHENLTWNRILYSRFGIRFSEITKNVKYYSGIRKDNR